MALSGVPLATVRRSEDGLFSVVDVVALFFGLTVSKASDWYCSQVRWGSLPPVAKRTNPANGRGKPMWFATREELEQILTPRHKLVTKQRRQQHLYVMRQVGRASCCKVGKTWDVELRRRQLQSGQPDPVEVVRVFEGMGKHEAHVHEKLAKFRKPDQPGHEWYALGGEEAALKIHTMLLRRPLRGKIWTGARLKPGAVAPPGVLRRLVRKAAQASK
jgi:hypothetical protein